MKKSAFLYVVLAGILWGTSGIFFNLLTPFGFSPLQMTAVRGIVSAIVITIYVFFHNRKLFCVKGKELLIFAFSGIAVFLTAAFYFAAIKESSVSTAVILMYTAPIFVMTYSVAFLGEKLNVPKIISVIFVIVGCALVSGITGGMEGSFLGIALGLGAGIAYSAYNIFTKIEMMHKSDSLSATLYCFIVMGVASLFVLNPESALNITMQNPVVIIPLLIGLGICTCVLPYFLYTLALRDIPAGTASALGIIEPMSATLFSVFLFGEKLSIAAVCGIVLILIAVFMLNKSNT